MILGLRLKVKGLSVYAPFQSMQNPGKATDLTKTLILAPS